MGVTLRGSPEWRAKIGDANRGRPCSTEQREKIAATLRGRAHTPEHTAAIRDGVIRYRRQFGWEQTADRAIDFERARYFLPSLDGHECVYCDASATERDHVIPWDQGGRATPENLVPSCSRCNISKNNRTPEQWLAAGLYAGGDS